MKAWTEREIGILTKYANTMTCTEIANVLGRTRDSVQQKIDKLSRLELAEIECGSLNPEDAIFRNRSIKRGDTYTDEEKRLVIKHTDFISFLKEHRKMFPHSKRTGSALETFFSHRGRIKQIIEVDEENQKGKTIPTPNIKQEITTCELYKKRASIIRKAILDLKLLDGDAIDTNLVFKSIKHQMDGMMSVPTFRAFLCGYGSYNTGEFRKDLDDIISNHNGTLVFTNPFKACNHPNVKSDSLPDVGELLVKILHAMAESNQISKESSAKLLDLIKIQESTRELFTEIRKEKVAPKEIIRPIPTQ